MSSSPRPSVRPLLAGTVAAAVTLALAGAVLTVPLAQTVSPRTLRVADQYTPANLSVVALDRGLRVSWSAVASATAYNVYVDGVLKASPASTSRTVDVNGLVNGQTYQVQVSSVVPTLIIVTGESAKSDPVPGAPSDGVPPGPPNTLTVSGTDGTAALSWKKSTDNDVAHYDVVVDGVLHHQVPAGNGGTVTTSVPGLANGRDHTFEVFAVDTSRQRSATAAAATYFLRDTVLPGTPQNVRATGGDRRVVVTFDAVAVADLDHYTVTLSDGRQVVVPAGTTTATITGLAEKTAYTVSVVAVDTSRNSSAASPAVAFRTLDTTAPDAPPALAGTGGDRAVALTWGAPVADDVDRYELTVSGGPVAAGGAVRTLAAASRALDVTGLAEKTSYTFSLVAIDAAGNRSAAATTTVSTRDTVAPDAPAPFTGVGGDHAVSLAWGAPTADDVDHYDLVVDGGPARRLPAGARSAEVTGLADATSYAFSLVAVDAAGNRSGSSVVSVTTLDTVAPAAPAGFTGTGGDHAVDLTWSAPAVDDVARYELSTDGAAPQVLPAGARSLTVTGLGEESAHTFSLVAIDAAGNRSPARTITVTTRDTVAPDAPGDLRATGGDHAAQLAWTAPAAGDVTRYVVTRTDGPATDGPATDVPAGTTTLSVGGLADDSAYTFRVVAVDAAGNTSPVAGPVTARTLDTEAPAAPADLVARAQDAAAELTWPAVPGAVRYVVQTGDGAAVLETTAPSARVTGLTNDTEHRFRVVAVDAAGNVSTPSATVAVTPSTPPLAPPRVTVLPSDAQLGVSWSPVAGAVGSYEVLLDGVVHGSVAPAVSTYRVSGLTNGRSYTVGVRAVTPAGTTGATGTVAAAPVAPGTPAGGAGASSGLAVTPDGRFVVTGTAARLEPADTNTAYELYVLDRQSGSARRLSPLSASATTTDATNRSGVAISDDGRYVALATTLPKVAADTNGLTDVYRLDLLTGEWRLASVPSTGRVGSTAGTTLQTGAAVHSTAPSVALSADGDRVHFFSERADLVAGDTNGAVDVFAKVMSTGAVVRVSATATGANLNRTVWGPALDVSPDGRFVVFPAANASGVMTLLRKDTRTGEVLPVSTATTASGQVVEMAVYRDAGDVGISDDGRHVVFSTTSQAPTGGSGYHSAGLAYRKDVVTGALARLGTGQTTVWEHRAALDPTGRYGFVSTVAALLPGDTNGRTDHYRRDLATGQLVLVTAAADGSATPSVTSGATSPAEYGLIAVASADSVVVGTLQPLQPQDANAVNDVYAKDVAAGTVTSVARAG
ncbi:hypothetical protein GTR02_06525 [Kineococcus sp. R8]|uniref:fibronectin type III domain-containing protein n=1 Tax=Kineococcus siccus TaxID=2696567 RepID=UPI001412CCD8|nr:fibronectin type III domain-containing protein [Kineococcus siccus]NAZ81469.1 hypothetical protein [Kineococcus siccus]